MPGALSAHGASANEPSLGLIGEFAGISRDELKLLDEQSELMWVPRGTTLLREGDPADKLYLVVSGRFFVIPTGKEEAIAEIGPGEPIGELAFFAGVRRTANVVAARDSKILALTHQGYAEVTRRVPGITSTILRAVAKRLARVTGASPAMRPKPPRTVALLPIGESHRLPDGFAATLASALAPAKAVSVSPTSLGGDPTSPDPNALRDRLAALEGQADLLLFELERNDTPFVRACLSLAEQLLVIAPLADTEASASQPTPFELHAAGLFLKSHRALVAVRDSASTPIAGTSTWLDARDLKLHHQVALDDRRDFERLGRFLTGSALGLVLGGGAALGCAHLGVAKALQEGGAPIDFFGGSSVGAAMGAAMAQGRTPDEVVELTEEMFVTNRAMRRLTFPLYSLLDHHVFDNSLRQNYSGLDVEDLPLNFFAVSASLTTNDAHIHRRGPTWEAVRASTAIPGVLPPFITKAGDVLVDGGMIDNVPVAVMRDLKIGPNVVVKLRRKRPWRIAADYEGLPTRRAMLHHLMFRRRGAAYPSLATVLIHGMLMTSEHRFEEHMAMSGDLFVVPDGIEGVGFLHWHKARQVADRAYRHMAGLLEQAGSLQALIQSPR
jgi:NTE family protein